MGNEDVNYPLKILCKAEIPDKMIFLTSQKYPIFRTQ